MVVSLRVRLLWWLLLPLAAFVLISGVSAYHNAKRMADLVQDSALLASARIIAGQVHWDDGVLRASAPPSALELFAPTYQGPEQTPSGVSDQVFYSVATAAHQVLSGIPDFPGPPAGVPFPAYYDTQLGGHEIHAVAYERRMYDAGTEHRVLITVGKTQASRDQMLLQVWRPQLLRQLAMLGLAAVLVFLGLTFELRPLIELKNEVTDRDPMELRPIRPERLHFELRPIVDAINQCIQRLNLHAAAQRRFVADAAHQLRTPLTLLGTQIQFARQRAPADAALVDALRAMHTSSRTMAELTDKLLLLAQAEAADGATLLRGRVNLASVAATALEELGLLAQQRGIDLGSSALQPEVHILGNESLVLALVMNLVDNAVRYSRPGDAVDVTVQRSGGNALLRVADTGPGIPAEARTRVFERFYRGATQMDGTGLGLSIVREIVQSYGGSISLASGVDGTGLVVTVELASVA